MGALGNVLTHKKICNTLHIWWDINTYSRMKFNDFDPPALMYIASSLLTWILELAKSEINALITKISSYPYPFCIQKLRDTSFFSVTAILAFQTW